MTDKHTLDLARVFAESVESRPSAYDEQVRAAAEVVSSLPDEWVGAERLREVVADHHIDMSEELMEALGALLPAPPAPESASPRPEDVPVFDPAYTYSDRHGDVWLYEEEEWWCYQQGYRTFRATGTPPAEYGPYTRIEE